MRGVRIARALLIAVAVGGAIFHAWQFRTFFVDDAAISYSYARTWAQGGGLVVHPGAERVEGYSNFLWVALLALGIKLGADPFGLSHVLGILGLVGTVVGSAVLLGRLRGKPSLLDALPAALVALLTPIPYWAMSGLEGSLYTCLLVWMCVALVAESDQPRRFPASALLAAALALTRPDGVLFVGVAVLYRIVVIGRARVLLHLLLATLPVALHHVARYAYYGYWFPNTFYVKAPAPTHLVDRFLRGSKGWVYLEKVVEQYRLLAAFGLGLLAPFVGGEPRRRLAPLLSVGAVIFFTIYAQGDWMSEGRFLAPALPLVLVLAIDLVGAIPERLARRSSAPDAAPARGLLRVGQLAAVLISGSLLYALVPAALRSTKARRNNYPVPVQSVALRANAVIEVVKELDLRNPSLLDGDLGATSYYGGRVGLRMVDLGALADITIARYQHDLPILREYVFYEEQPTFMRLSGFWTRSGLQLLPEMREDYTPITTSHHNLGGVWLRRDAITVDGIDTRRPLGSLPVAGLDLIGSDLDERKATLYLRVVQPSRALPQLTSAEKSVRLRFAGSVYPPSEWQRGEILRFVVDRPPGALQLCDPERCLAIEDGKIGAQPIPRSTPPVVDGQRALADGLAAEARGDHDAAFASLLAAIHADRRLATARRTAEQIRPRRSEMAPVRLLAPLGEARRAFYAAPSPATMTKLARLALAAGRPEVAARAHRATQIVPDAADGATLLADVLEGRSRLARRSNDVLSHQFETGMTGWTAEGDAFRNGPRRILHSSDALSPRADKLFDPFLHIDGAYWALPVRILVDAVGSSAQLLPVIDSKDWSLTQLTYVLFTPAVWWLRDVVGVEGRHFMDSGLLGDLHTGSLRSRALDAVDEVCFSVGGGNAGVGVRVHAPGAAPIVVSGQRDEVLRRSCVPLGGKAGATIEVFDESLAPWGHVMFDDLECFTDGRSVPCAK